MINWRLGLEFTQIHSADVNNVGDSESEQCVLKVQNGRKHHLVELNAILFVAWILRQGEFCSSLS